MFHSKPMSITRTFMGQKTPYSFFVAVASLVVLGVFSLTASVSASDARRDWVVQAFEQNRQAVVNIQGDKIDEYSASSKDPGKSYNGMGTGIIIDERGYIVTNFHVVDGIRKIQVITYDKTQYTATLVGRDTDTDLAIIKINPRLPLQTITLGRSDDLIPGERCMSIGNPYGYSYTVTDGRVSGLEREVEVNENLVYSLAIQTSAPINPGNSGGPLINVDGEMIGINAAIRQGAECIAFAIPIDQVVHVAAKLIGDVADRTNYHGLMVTHVDDGSGKPVVAVESVANDSPAASAGLREGDIIERIGKYTIANKLDFSRAFMNVKAREDLAMTVRRDSESYEAAMTLGTPRNDVLTRNRNVSTTVPPGRSSAASNAKTGSQARKPNLDDLVWERLGIRYAPMAKDEYRRKFAQHLADRPHGGVVVKEIRPGSVLAEEGVMPGDVIVGIHEWVTTSQNDVRYIATAWPKIQESNKSVQVLLFRDGISYFTEIPLGK